MMISNMHGIHRYYPLMIFSFKKGFNKANKNRVHVTFGIHCKHDSMSQVFCFSTKVSLIKKTVGAQNCYQNKSTCTKWKIKSLKSTKWMKNYFLLLLVKSNIIVRIWTDGIEWNINWSIDQYYWSINSIYDKYRHEFNHAVVCHKYMTMI